MANCNYKVKIKDIQNKYKFKIFCMGDKYDDTEIREEIEALEEELTDTKEEVERANLVYNALPKVEGTGESITLNNTANAPLKLDLKGNTYQDGEPTPDAPIPVNVVSGDNSIIVCGKNLFDKDNANQINHWFVSYNKIILSNNATSFYIKCKPNTQYTISKVSSTRLQFWCTTEKPDVEVSASDSLNLDYNFTGTVKTITTTSDANYLLCYYYLSTSDTLTEEEIRNTIQIEEGSTATTYEAYQGQNYPINLGSLEMCRIEDYEDYFYKDNGNWYLHKKIGKAVLDGSENWFLNQYGFFQVNVPNTTSDSSKRNGYSNYFKYAFNSQTDNTFFSVDNLIRFRCNTFSNENDFKNWLSTHNTIVYYILATPTDTQITDTTLVNQLNALEKALAYKNQTNISQTNADKPFIIDASTIYDLSNLVTRVAVLETE